MGIADKYREKPLESSVADDEILDPFDVLLDGSFCRKITWDGIAIQYIPLTISELRETNSEEERMILMLAKAMKRRVEQGIDDKEDILLDVGSSYYNNASKLLNSLNQRDRVAFTMRLFMDIGERETRAVQTFENLKEKYVPRAGGRKKHPNALDATVSFIQTFKKTGYTVHDVANMTMLQYIVYTQAVTEAAVREANDHSHMMGDGGTQGAKLPGSKFNGKQG